MKPLKINAALQIAKPVNEVFDAIIDPAQMSNYFIENGSGTLVEGKEIIWKFPEFDQTFNIRILSLKHQRFVQFR